jgi:hypothetical protein
LTVTSRCRFVGFPVLQTSIGEDGVDITGVNPQLAESNEYAVIIGATLGFVAEPGTKVSFTLVETPCEPFPGTQRPAEQRYFRIGLGFSGQSATPDLYYEEGQDATPLPDLFIGNGNLPSLSCLAVSGFRPG